MCLVISFSSFAIIYYILYERIERAREEVERMREESRDGVKDSDKDRGEKYNPEDYILKSCPWEL